MPTKDKHKKHSDSNPRQRERTGTGGTPTAAQYTPYGHAGAYYSQQSATPALNTPAPPALTTPYTRRFDLAPNPNPPYRVSYAGGTLTPGYAAQPANPVQSTARTTTTGAPSSGATPPAYAGYSNLPYRSLAPGAIPPSVPAIPNYYGNVSYSTGTGTGTGTGVLRGGGAGHSTTRQPTGTNAPVVPGYYAAAPPTAQQGTSTDQGKAPVAGYAATDSTSTSGAGASTSGVTRTFQPATLVGGVINTAAHKAIATGHNVSAGTPMFFVSSFDIFKRPGAQIHPAFSVWAKDPSSAHYTSVMWRADDQNRILPMAVTSYGARHHGHSDPYKYLVRLHLNKDHKTFEYESLGTLTEDRPSDPAHLHLTKKLLFFTEPSGNRRQVLGDNGMFKPDTGNTTYPSHDDPHTRLHTSGISGTMIQNTWEIQNDKSLLISAESGKKAVGIITHDENADVYVVQAPIVFTHSARKDTDHGQYPKQQRDDLIALVFLALLVMPIGHSAFVTKVKWWAGKLVGAVAKGGSAWKG